MQQALYEDAVKLLKRLIATPSLSKDEHEAANIIAYFFTANDIPFQRDNNNVWACNKHFDPGLPTILLNSHIDTVKPAEGWKLNPYVAVEQAGKLFGLGSNDAGGCLVSLMAVFRYFYALEGLRYNLIMAATAEEEISGQNGISALLPLLPAIDFAIVGEPTQMQMAVAEKGLMVLDCTAYGKAGHAARDEGENAIYKALADIAWFRSYPFPKVSQHLGAVRMNVTVINAGKLHNQVPDRCDFTVDVRTTDAYTHEETLDIIRKHVTCEVRPRSTRLKPSSISQDHPIVRAGISLGLEAFGSPTLSDQALMPFASVKIGPGDSARSHTADEYIYLNEIKQGISTYIELLNALLIPETNTVAHEALAEKL